MPASINYRSTFLRWHIERQLLEFEKRISVLRRQRTQTDSEKRDESPRSFPHFILRSFFYGICDQGSEDRDTSCYFPIAIYDAENSGTERYRDVTELILKTHHVNASQLGIVLIAQLGAGKTVACCKAFCDCFFSPAAGEYAENRPPQLAGFLPCWVEEFSEASAPSIRGLNEDPSQSGTVRVMEELLAHVADPRRDDLIRMVPDWLQFGPPLLLFVHLAKVKEKRTRSIIAKSLVEFQKKYRRYGHRCVMVHESLSPHDAANDLGFCHDGAECFGSYGMLETDISVASRYFARFREFEAVARGAIDAKESKQAYSEEQDEDRAKLLRAIVTEHSPTFPLIPLLIDEVARVDPSRYQTQNGRADFVREFRQKFPATAGAGVPELVHGLPQVVGAKPSEMSLFPALLARFLPNAEDFEKMCAALRLPVDLGATPAERWSRVYDHCSDQGRIEEFHQRVVEQFPRRVPGMISCNAAAAKSSAIRTISWPEQRREVITKAARLLPGTGRIGSKGNQALQQSLRHYFGLVALDWFWPTAESCWPALKHRINKLDVDFDFIKPDLLRANSEFLDFIDEAGGSFVRVEDAVCLAAEALACWFKESSDEGEAGVRLMLNKLDQLPQQCQMPLALLPLPDYWPNAKSIIDSWQAEMLRQDPHKLSTRDRLAILVRLRDCDRLLFDAEQRSLRDADPSCVLWAYKAGLSAHVAELLEQLDERNLSAHLSHLGKADPAGRKPLLQRMRRLLMEGEADNLPDGPEPFALRCSLPSATADDLNILAADQHALPLWFDCLDARLSLPQVDLLAQLFQKRRNKKEKNRATLAGRRLAAQFDLGPAWGRLGLDRKKWVQELSIQELRQTNFADLKTLLQTKVTTMPRDEYEAFNYLLSRLQEATRR